LRSSFQPFTMRTALLIIVAVALAACRRAEPSEVTVELDKVSRVKDCNVWLRSVTIKPDSAFMTW